MCDCVMLVQDFPQHLKMSLIRIDIECVPTKLVCQMCSSKHKLKKKQQQIRPIKPLTAN